MASAKANSATLCFIATRIKRRKSRMNPLFNGAQIFAVIEYQKQELKRAFQGVPNPELDADHVAVAARLIERFSINVPVLDEEKKYALTKEVQVDVRRDPRRHILDRSRPFYIAGTEVRIVVPFHGDAGLFDGQPTMFDLNPPFGEIHANELHLIYELTDSAFDVEATASRTIGQIKKYFRDCSGLSFLRLLRTDRRSNQTTRVQPENAPAAFLADGKVRVPVEALSDCNKLRSK